MLTNVYSLKQIHSSLVSIFPSIRKQYNAVLTYNECFLRRSKVTQFFVIENSWTISNTPWIKSLESVQPRRSDKELPKDSGWYIKCLKWISKGAFLKIFQKSFQDLFIFFTDTCQFLRPRRNIESHIMAGVRTKNSRPEPILIVAFDQLIEIIDLERHIAPLYAKENYHFSVPRVIT